MATNKIKLNGKGKDAVETILHYSKKGINRGQEIAEFYDALGTLGVKNPDKLEKVANSILTQPSKARAIVEQLCTNLAQEQQTRKIIGLAKNNETIYEVERVAEPEACDWCKSLETPPIPYSDFTADYLGYGTYSPWAKHSGCRCDINLLDKNGEIQEIR